ncbi:hypothetical protein SDC9_82363 [bioreactor metagenome]|uniref:Uncharacterized protein n=1 Tax=bioreactor metagenome TaxID=1076179 RepID=A0A644Z5C1_9ZZZZ
MLEARAAAGRAAPIARVEAELRGGVATLARQRRVGKNLADRIPRAHIAHRVGARGLADGRLVNEHHVRQMVRAQQTVVRARRFRGLAELAQQCRSQHVLDQCGLARAGHAGHRHQPLQRKFDGHILQVVLARAFQNQARRGVGHQPLDARADGLAPAQVHAGQRVGAAQIAHGAVEHNLATALTGRGAHVDHAVGSQHHGRVVLHHHQRVARIAQAQHGFGDAVHVARVQADAGFIEHEQRVHQRRAQRRRQVDALHLATRERAALPVQREVANAHVAQVLQARGNFGVQQLQRLGRAVLQGIFGSIARPTCVSSYHIRSKPGEEATQPLQRQQHQVVQAQAGQRLQLRTCPGHALGHAALFRGQHGIGIFAGANTPQQALGLQARAAAGRARRVAAVLGQQHADVHLVGLALQVLEEALDAIPLLVPLALPVRRTADDPLLLLGGELVPGGVARNASGLGVAHEVVLRLFPRRRLDGLDRPGAQRELVVGNHQPVIDADHAAKASAGVARAHGRVEREHRRNRLAVAQVAVGAMQPRGEAPQIRLALVIELVDDELAGAALEAHLNRLDHTRTLGIAQAEAVGHHVQQLARAGGRGHLALGLHLGETTGRQPLLDLLGRRA